MSLGNVASALTLLRSKKFRSIARPGGTLIFCHDKSLNVMVETIEHERFYPEDVPFCPCRPPKRRIPPTQLATEVRTALELEGFEPFMPPRNDFQKIAGLLAFVHEVPNTELPSDVQQALEELIAARTRADGKNGQWNFCRIPDQKAELLSALTDAKNPNNRKLIARINALTKEARNHELSKSRCSTSKA